MSGSLAKSSRSRLHTKSRVHLNASTTRIALYSSAFLLFTGIIAFGYQKPSTSGLPQASTVNALSSTQASTPSEAPSVDEIIAIDVAASLSEQANLPIATNLANTSVSLSAKSQLAQTDDTSTSKPQIVQTNSNGRTVQTYSIKPGDTTPSVAEQFGISADTIRWANGIQGDALEPGREIKILPVNGVLYTAADGDTAASIAAKYSGNESRITLFNDLDMNTLAAGRQIIVPDGVMPETERPGYRAPTTRGGQNQSFDGGSGQRLSNNLRATAGNRYAPGNCTWYVFERRAQLGRPIGSFWGNANTWAFSARSAGFTVNGTPAPGAIFVDRAGYFGHVGVVESVSPNGDVVLTEMNNFAYGGFNIVNSRTISAGQAAAYQYIH